jgi:hypothetical protein
MAKYIHTINGKPATFDGFQICFATFYGKPNILCDSLKQIRKQQKISVANRKSKGFPAELGDYGHLRYE